MSAVKDTGGSGDSMEVGVRDSLYVVMVLDYLESEKSCWKNSTQTSYMLFAQLSLMITSYISKP